MAALDWSQCPAVESVEGKVSGAWVFKGTRTPVVTIFENLEDGMTIDEVLEQFPLAACEPPVPNDLPSLMRLMNDNYETIAVAAVNKVSARYGKAGLLQVLKEGRSGASGLAGRYLANFPDPEVETALIAAVNFWR
jgi:uncharacterized protein (DUF433 family)